MGAAAGWEEPSARDSPPGDGPSWDRPPTSPGRIVLLGLLAVVGTALLLRAGDGTDQLRTGLPGSLPVVPAPEEPPAPIASAAPAATPAPAGTAVLDEAGGAWQDLPDAPVSVPATHEAVLTDRELIVFGGLGEVAAYDPDTRAWRRLEDFPGRVANGEHVHGLVWTGSEVLALAKPLDDLVDTQAVHALDPESGTWRRLPDGPVPVLPPVVSIWTGAQLIYWGLPAGPRVREGDPAVGGAWDASDNAWALLPRAPEPRVSGAGGVLTSEGIVIWGQRAGGAVVDWGPGATAALLNPSSHEWSELPPPPLHDPGRGVGVWNGTCVPGGDRGCERVLIWGAPLHVAPSGLAAPVGGASFDFASGTWSRLPTVPGLSQDVPWSSVYGFDGAWTGGRLAVVGGYPDGVALTLEDGGTRWRRLPPRQGVVNASVHWTGRELLVWGGFGPTGSSVGLQTWLPTG